MLYIDTYCPFLSRTCELILWKQSPFVSCFTVFFSHYSLQFQLKKTCVYLNVLALFLRASVRSHINMKYYCTLSETCIKRLKYNTYIFSAGHLSKKGEVIYTYFNELSLEH